MKAEIADSRNFLYPPGGILIWIIVFVELLTFGAALVVFEFDFRENYAEFFASQQKLNKLFGLINSLILITSGYFMATTLNRLKNSENKSASTWLLFAILAGTGFLVLKGIEYSMKIESGYVLRYDSFFTYYWLLTGFHFVHVLVGVFILIAIWPAIRNGKYNADNTEDVESAGIFWHMVDLIWIILFPILYLLN